MMLAVGHITLGYITGKILGKATDQNLNIPVLWMLSLLPDIDLIIPGLQHRGPTHSIIVALLFFTPLLIVKARKTAPYFTALATHSLIGDYFTDSGITLFWPLSPKWVKYENTIMMGSPSETYIETALFAILIATLILSGDFKHLFNPDRRNTVFIIPLCTIFLPVIFKYPIEIPEPLIIIHLILLAMIVLSLAMSLIQAISTIAR
jgi:membrane-bound metal-dependent hydrolase YbcI (DUF457 family)